MNPDLLKAFRDKNSYHISKIVALGHPNLLRGRSRQGNTALHLAARFGDKHVVQQILRHDDSSSFLYETNLHGETPMHIAAKFRNTFVINLLLENDNNRMTGREGGRDNILWMRDSQLNTPLHKAVANRQESAAVLLINSDPLTTLFVNNAKESPLSVAIDTDATYIAWYIIKKHLPSLQYRGGTSDLTLLHSVVIRQDYVLVVEIVNRNSGLIHTKDHYGRNPLHYAAAVGNVTIAKQLLKADASSSLGYQVDCINCQTPLHLAAENGKLSVLKLLLIDYPDSIDAVDGKQRSILHLAALNGNVDTVRFVMKLPEVEDLMIKSTDEDGNTPLHLAAMNFHWEVVDILCKYKRVNIRATNHNQLTALAIVESSTDPHRDIKKYLSVKILKEAITARAFYPEDILQDTRFRAMEINAIKIRIGEKREMVNTLLVMATLIATFTFTAAFTIPGGYKNDGPNEGMAVLASSSFFKVFVIAVTIAMTSSMTAAFFALLQIHCGNKGFMNVNFIPLAISLILLGLVSMSLAFSAGLFVVLSDKYGLSIFVVLIGVVFPTLLSFTIFRVGVIVVAVMAAMLIILKHPSFSVLAWVLIGIWCVKRFDFSWPYLFYLMESAWLRWYHKAMKARLNSELYPSLYRRTRNLVLLELLGLPRGILRLLRILREQWGLKIPVS